MIFQALDEYNINDNEYAFLLGDHAHTDSSFPMNIPKLMPMISKGYYPGTNNVVYNNNIFANDTDCRPQTRNALVSQNYLMVERFWNTNFSYKADGNGVIHHGARFLISVLDKNIRDMRINDSI